jgi:cytochrome c peroxidase
MAPIFSFPRLLRALLLGMACDALASSQAYGALPVAKVLGSVLKPAPAQPAPAEEVEEPAEAPGPLSNVPIPTPPDLDKYVKNKAAAIKLGKALFWDMQVGSDGKTACATCHWHAGADIRTVNQVNPGVDLFGPVERFMGRNHEFVAGDFPFHRLQNPHEPRSGSNPVVFDTSEVAGSQGVVKKQFVRIVEGSAVDQGNNIPDDVFNLNGVNIRQATGRNSPTNINAIFNDRNFWDGRANRFFNGVNIAGDMDPSARVWQVTTTTPGLVSGVLRLVLGKKPTPVQTVSQIAILIDNSSLASQAVGPPMNGVEMSWIGRSFPELARKMLWLRPLAQQEVHSQDSVFAMDRHVSGMGLKVQYADLIRTAFQDVWWNSDKLTPNGYTVMEANFSLFFGLAIQAYEATLVSDDAPFDRYAKGDQSALTAEELQGLSLFLNEGKCINCHGGAEFAGGTVSEVRDEPIEFMAMQTGPDAFYDNGYYNIGVRPTNEDLGVGAIDPVFGPWALSRRVQQGQNPKDLKNRPKIGSKDRIAVNGAFKTPSLRNVELTGPYFHNGGERTLKEVVMFYARRGDFFHENLQDLDPDVEGIPEIRGDDVQIDALVAFMKALTDERVKYQKAPFDHPQLIVPNGHSGVSGGVAIDDNFTLPAVGAGGGEAFGAFEDLVH